ncbi:hypothetical protein LH991_14025 [Schleiferilactobacillus harbinensis]|uniref:hypothetical protein n=1 Tax=Schleiferilactobacillus harbinensis TaxID=304207 RepID=UPI000555AE71|nr:hypothetical protein [Schleiferilactobacillus harbinensis]QFR65561.1 hypothetical protein LH991_14025 [Schleiferilactobacillus harbinensis]
MSIDEWAEMLSALAVIVSCGSWLFKRIALDPLRADIQLLSQQIGQQLKVHEKELADLEGQLKSHDHELDSHSVRLTRLEDRTGIKGDDKHNED